MGVVSLVRELKIDEVLRSRIPLSRSNSALWQGRGVHVLFKFTADTHGRESAHSIAFRQQGSGVPVCQARTDELESLDVWHSLWHAL